MYNNVKCDKENVKCGVPEGSLLGPLIFWIYINDLTTMSTNSLFVLFADDTNIFLAGKKITICVYDIKWTTNRHVWMASL